MCDSTLKQAEYTYVYIFNNHEIEILDEFAYIQDIFTC